MPMNQWIRRILNWIRRHRKGAATMEFIILVPLFILLAMIIWQLVLGGLAIVDTHAALRDAVKIASTTGDEKKAVEQGKESFGSKTLYKLKSMKVNIDQKDNEVHAKAKVEIPFIFGDKSSPFVYETDSRAPLLNQSSGLFGFGGGAGAPLLTEGGILGPPVGNMIITSPYGMRKHPVLGIYKMHWGVDFGGPMNTPIYASADGVVVHAGPGRGYGNYVVIDHGNGIRTLYAHSYANQIYVKEGQTVKRGDHIAGIGSAGWSTGPHLHYEVHVNGQRVNPMPYLGGPVAQR